MACWATSPVSSSSRTTPAPPTACWCSTGRAVRTEGRWSSPPSGSVSSRRNPGGVGTRAPYGARVLPLPPADELRARLPRLLLGLTFFGVGIGLMVRADLGLGPWDVLHQGVAERTGISMGVVTILTGLGVLRLWTPLGARPALRTVL